MKEILALTLRNLTFKFFKENRSKYATSIECLNSMGDHAEHDGFPPDSHGYDFNQIATWVKNDNIKDLDLNSLYKFYDHCKVEFWSKVTKKYRNPSFLIYWDPD